MHLLVTGARGFVGEGLLAFLNGRGIGRLAAGFRHPQTTREGIAEMVAWAHDTSKPNAKAQRRKAWDAARTRPITQPTDPSLKAIADSAQVTNLCYFVVQVGNLHMKHGQR